MTNKPENCYHKPNIAEEPYGPSTTLFNKRIWTIEDVVAFTGFSKSTVYKMTSRREIPHRKRGKKLFFLPGEVWNWIEES